jgi:hypothetical protein
LSEEQDGYLYHAVVSYLMPMKISVGVYAESKEDAEQALYEKYDEAQQFKIIYLDNATPDVAKQLINATEH